MSQITLDTLVVGTYTVRELLAAERLWTPDRPPSTPEQIIERIRSQERPYTNELVMLTPRAIFI